MGWEAEGRGGEEGREGWFIYSVVTQSLVMVKEKKPHFFHTLFFVWQCNKIIELLSKCSPVG